MPTNRTASAGLPPPRFVERDGYHTAYYLFGPDNGSPLMLCHGLAASAEQFAADARFFAQNGFRVLVPDLRGHGQSRCPTERRDTDFALSELAADLIAMLDAENIAATDWVGNSLGGVLALWLMGGARARLRRFASFGTAYAFDTPQGLVTLSTLGLKLFGTGLAARVVAPMTCRDAEPQALVRSILARNDPDAVLRTARQVAQYDFTANARTFDGPMLLIRGHRDHAVNAALKPVLASMRAKANFRLVDIKDAGHCANLDRPDVVRHILLDFLNDTPA